ncbi:MAG TPA: glycosyltransferase [Firmicutes bacterium]|nr:glycosyltransferase [Bacillota bacterium]
MDSLSVIMVCPSWGRRCGIAEYTHELVAELAGLGVHPRVLSGNQWETALDNRVLSGSVVHFQYEYALYNPKALAMVIRRAGAAGPRLVFTLHDFHPASLEHNALIRGAPAHFVVHSELMRETLHSSGIPKARIRVIPMGARAYSVGDRKLTRSQLGIGQAGAVGFFGFAMAQKGIVQLAKAIELLQSSHPGLKLFIFSSSPFFDPSADAGLRSVLAGQGLLKNVVIQSEYVPAGQIATYLHAMDVNVFPYESTGFIGTSAACRVAMAAGRPIITTNIPYFSDLKDEVFKIPSPDPGQIAQAIAKFLDNPDMGSGLIAACNRYLIENSWHNVARRHLALYKMISYRMPEPSSVALPNIIYSGEKSISPGVPESVWVRVVERFAPPERK